MLKKHFVTFISPGTFVAERTTKEIAAWDTDLAVEMARKIKERYGAKPYGFYFTTRGRGDKDLDSKEVARSNGIYYLGGTIETLEQVKARNYPKDKILISNMEANHWDRIIVNRNSWTWTQPFEAHDVLLDVTL